MEKPNTVDSHLWDQIEAEKRRDKRMKRISIVAWSATGIVVLAYGAIVFSQFFQFRKLAESGMFPASQVWATLTPLIAVIGMVVFLAAILSTIGVFIRMRSTSLKEIQTRLGALETLVMNSLGDE